MTSAAPTIERKVREYEFTNKDFEQVRKMIYARAGISLSVNKQDMVYSRLARRLREKSLTRFSDYLQLLDGDDDREWEAFTNALTTNLTSFYREAHHFPMLAEHLTRCWQARREPLSIWCCAASTGEEPYTIAMTAAEAFKRDDPPVKILATDLDTNVLASASAGIYDLQRTEPIGAERMKRFFLKGSGDRAGKVKAAPALRKMITFRQQNLLDATWQVKGPFDIIMCRNVMIYFDKNTQRQILEKFAPLMRDDGLLFAGHSESFFHAADLFKLRGKTTYELSRKAGAGR